MENSRPPRDVVFMKIALLLAERASCGRMSVGAIIVADGKHIISSGVNGPLSYECQKDLKCDLTQPCQFAIHAEHNAIRYAIKRGIELQNTTLYCTHQPCKHCSEQIVSNGIIRVVYKEPYRLIEGLELLKLKEIECLNLSW